MTRVAWITPCYPPDRGGVSDHSCAMVSELEAAGHDVLVCVKPHERGFHELDAELDAYRPDVIIVAYVPLGFAPRTGGISPAFTRWCMRLRRFPNTSTLLLAHEASLPAAVHWRRREFKMALLGAVQVAQFEILARSFGRVVFSHKGNRDAWAERIPALSDQFHTVRICSSIPFARSYDPRSDLTTSGYSVPERSVLFFGSGHDSVLFDYVEAALVELLKVDPKIQLVVVGVDPAKLRRLQPSLAEFGPRVQALGFVPAREVSLWLQTAELVLAPLSEGVNARKTTVMAALHHGCAVVTTSGFHTRDDIPWAQICALASLNRTAFAAVAVKCLQDSSWRTRIGEAGRADYEAQASPSVTAGRLLAYAASQRG